MESAPCPIQEYRIYVEERIKHSREMIIGCVIYGLFWFADTWIENKNFWEDVLKTL